MKKILYILFTASLLAVSCTEEIPVTRDHDIDAEVTDIQTKMEMTTLYCNLNEAPNVDLEKLSLYLAEKNADVAMFVAPVTTGGDFKAWLTAYAAEAGDLTVLESHNDDGRLMMAALVKNELSTENFSVVQGVNLLNAVLHFKTNGIHFVVTELEPARNAIPSDWEAQVEKMNKDKKKLPLTYNPDVLAARKAELANVIKQTLDNKSLIKDTHWMFAVNMNSESPLDIAKYGHEFLLEDYYDDVTEEFLSTETTYFTVNPILNGDDAYFGLNSLMLYNNMVDCNAVHHSVYTPSSEGGLRRNFLYATDECWNMFQTFNFDTAVAADLGVINYPIIVTLKSEE